MKAYADGKQIALQTEPRWQKRWRWLPLWLSKRMKLGSWYMVVVIGPALTPIGTPVTFMYETNFTDDE